jgi:hypothetical protein
MAFAGTQAVHASNRTFNDVGRNQFNIQLPALSSPFPSLTPAFNMASYISSMTQQAQASQGQIQAFSVFIETLLTTLNDEYHSGRLVESRTSVALDNLHE